MTNDERFERARNIDDPCSVRAEGVLYFLGERVGGACFEVFFADGRIVQTTDLVLFGRAPEGLPDNAVVRACP
jgi:hypothetical protein